MGKTINYKANEGVTFLPKKNINLSDIASQRGDVVYREGDKQLTADLHEFGMDAIGVLGNHSEEAALLQPFTNKAWRASKNFVNLAGTTFLDGVFGTVAGLANMAKGGEDGVIEFNDFVNNPLSAGLQEYVEEARKDNVRYRTAQQQNNEWYQNAATSNFWLDQFENAGFMVGALGAGVLTGGVGAEVMGIKNTAKLSKLINALSKAEASGDVAKIASIKSKLTALKLNPLDTEKIADDIIQMADKIKTRTAVNQVTSATLGAMGEARIEAITNGNDFKEQQLAKLKEQYGDDIPAIKLKELDDASKYLQNSIFALNTGILSLSNYTQFKNLFTGGVKLNENIAKNLVVNAAEGSGYAMKQMSKAEKILRRTVAGVKNPISEMTEEQLQFAVSEGSKNYFDLENDRESKDWVMNVLGSTYEGLAKAYGSAEGWENAFSGALMGAIGLPSIKRTDKNKIGLTVEMGGGVFTGLREYDAEQKATQAAIDKATKYATESNFRKLIDFNTTDASIQKAKQAALINDNEAAFRTADKVQLANMVAAFDAIGRLDDLKAKLNDIESIVKGIDAVEAPSQKQLISLKEQATATASQIQELESLTATENDDDKFKADLASEIEKHKISLEKLNKAIQEAEAKGVSELTEVNTIEEERKAKVAKAADTLRTLLSFKTIEEKDGKQVEIVNDSFSDIKDDDTLIKTVQKSIDKKRNLIDSMVKTRNAVDTAFASKSEEVRNSLYLNTIQQEDLVKRGNSILNELKNLDIKESDEDLADVAKDWRSKNDIIEFSNLLNKEGGLDRFLKAANTFAKNNPTHDATINKFVDLITIAKFRNETIKQYYELVTNDKLIDEEIERKKIDRIKERRERIARDKATNQAVLDLYDNMTRKVKSLDETKDEFVSGTITLTGKDDKGNTVKKVLYFKENDTNRLYSKGDEGTKRSYVKTADIIEAIQDNRTGKNSINYVEYLDNYGAVSTTEPKDGKFVANIFRYDTITYEDGERAARKIEVSNEEARIQARIDSLEALITESEDFLKDAEEREVGEITKELEVLQQEAKQLESEITNRESSNRFNTKAARQKTEQFYNKLIELDAKIQKLLAVKQQRLNDVRSFYSDVLADISTFKANLAEAEQRQKMLLFTAKEYIDKKTDDFIGGDYNKRLEEARIKYKEAEAADPFIFQIITKLENEIESLVSTSSRIREVIKNFVDSVKEQLPYIETLSVHEIWTQYVLYPSTVKDKNIQDAIENFILEVSNLTPVEYMQNSIGDITNKIDNTIRNLKDRLDNKKLDKQLLDAQKSFSRQLSDYKARLTELQKGRDLKSTEQARLVGNEEGKGIETTLWDGSIQENINDAIPVDLFQWFVTTGRDSNKNWDKDSQNETVEERRVFRWIENEAVKHNTKLSDLRLMTVTIHDPVYGLGKEKSVYNNEKVSNEDPYLANHNDDDIRLILFNVKTGQPVEAYGGVVYTTMRTPNVNFNKADEGVRYSFYSDKVGTALTEEEKADVLKNALDANKKMRETIKATPEKNYFLDVQHVVQGRMIAEKEPNSVVGTLVDSVEEIDNVPVIISTGKIDTESKKMVYPKGRVVISDTRNENVSRVVPANTRKLNEVEAETAYQLMKQYVTTYANTAGDTGVKEQAASKQKGLPYQIPTLLKNIVYLGSSSEKPIFMKGEFVFVTLPNGETEAIKAENIENYKEFIKGVLKEKVLQVDANSLSFFNKNKKNKKPTTYKEVLWTGSGFETIEWPSYKHYLLSPAYPDGTPRDISNIPVTVKLRMKQVGASDADVLAGNARRYQGGYIVFGSQLKDKSQTMTENKAASKKDNNNPTIEKIILTSKKFNTKKITIDLKDNKISFNGFDFKGMESSIIEAVNRVVKDAKLLENLSKASELEVNSTLDKIYELIVNYSNIPASSSIANYNVEVFRDTVETASTEEANDDTQTKEQSSSVEDSGIVNKIDPLSNFFGVSSPFEGENPSQAQSEKSEEPTNPDNNDPLGGFFNRVQTEDDDVIPTIDAEQAMQNLADLLGENALSEERLGFVKGLIDGIVGGRVLKNGKILLSEIATLGTEYHEAFHYVSQFLIPVKEREELYAEWRAVNNKPNATNIEVEEGLAEGFRNYALYKREGQSKKQTSLFRRLLDLIKTALALNTSDKIDAFYDRILRGEFKAQPKLVDEMLFNKLDSKEYDEDRTFAYFFSQYLQREGFEKLFTFSWNSGDLKEAYSYAFKQTLKLNGQLEEYEKLVAKKKAERKEGEPEVDIEEININNVGLRIRNYIRNFGIQIGSVYGDLLEEGTITEDIANDGLGNNEEYSNYDKGNAFKEAFFTSNSAKMKASLKLVIGTLTNNIDFHTTANKIQDVLKGIGSIDEALIRLKTNKDPNLKRFADKIEAAQVRMNEGDMYAAYFLSSFFNQYAKTELKFYNIIANGDGTLQFSDSNTTRLEDRIREMWKVNMALLKNGYVDILPSGKPVLTDKAKKAVLGNNDDYINFLQNVGITFSDVAAIKEKIKKEKADSADGKSQLSRAIESVVNELRKSDDILNDIFNKRVSDIKGFLKVVINAEAEISEDAVENSAVTAKGETIFTITQPSFLTRLNTVFNKGLLPEYLQNDPFAEGSLIADYVKSKKKIVIGVANGMANQASEGEDTAKLSYASYLITELNHTLANRYSLLITGDKKTPYLLEMESPFIETKNMTDEAVIEECVNRLYRYFEVEVKIANTWKSKLRNMSESDSLVSGEQYLGNLVMFKDILDITDTEKTAKQKLTKYVEQTIAKNKELFLKNKVITNSSARVVEPVVKKILGKSTVSTSKDVNALVTAFTVNHMVSSVEQMKMFFGNPAYYNTKKNDHESFIDMFKRLAGLVGTTKSVLNSSAINTWMNKFMPRVDGKERKPNDTVKVITFEDVKGVNAELKELGYSDIEEVDSFAVMLDDCYRDLLFKSDSWTESMNQTWLRESTGEVVDVDNDNQVLPSLKPLIYGTSSTLAMKPFYGKLASLRLSPTLIKAITANSDKVPVLSKLLDIMKEGQMDIAMFKSGNKIGSKVKLVKGKYKNQEFYTAEGDLATIEQGLVTEISMDYLGVQVENAPKIPKEVTRGSQEAAIVMSNFAEDGVIEDREIVVAGKNIKLAAAIDEYFNTQNEITRRLREKVEQKLKLKRNSKGSWIFEDNAKALIELIINETNRRGDVSKNTLDAIIQELRRVDESGKSNVNLDLLVNKDRVENILFSLVEGKVINQKRKGGAFVQFPATGMELDVRKRTEDGNYDGSRLKYTNGKAEVMLPWFFKGLIPEGESISNIDPRLLQMYGFRIPTEQPNSLESIVVVGFLPKSYGNTVIVPQGITTKVGSDFDFDKLNIYIPNFRQESNFDAYYNSKFFNRLSIKTKELIKSKPDLIPTIKKAYIDRYKTADAIVSAVKGSTTFKNLPEANQQELLSVVSSLYDALKDKTVTSEMAKSNYVYIDANTMKPGEEIAQLENRMLELTIGLLDAKPAKEKLEPNSIKELKDLAKTVQDKIVAKGMRTKPDYKFSDLMQFSTLADLRTKFWYGKDLVGIFALHNKHHPLAQITGLKIANEYKNLNGDTVKYSINFKNGPKLVGNSYLLGRKTSEGTDNLISVTLGQSVSLVVDVVKNPEVLELLNINAKTADAAAFLIRAGVPAKTALVFMSQPIIREYVERTSLLNSIGLPKDGVREIDVIEDLLNKYSVQSNIDLSYEDLIEFKSTIQNQVLRDFLVYKDLGSKLSKFQSGNSFDTRGFNSMNTIKNQLDAYKDVVEEGLFTYSREYTGGTFLNEFSETFKNTKDYFKNLFLKTKNTNFENLMDTYKKEILKSELSSKKRDLISKRFDNDLTAALIATVATNNYTLNDAFDRLFTGPNSLPKRLQKYKKANPSTPLDKLFELIDKEGDGIDNIRLFTRKISPYDVDAIADTVGDMITRGDAETKKLAQDLIQFAILQSGFNSNQYSFLNTLNAGIVNKFFNALIGKNAKSILDNFNWNQFIEDFYANNWKDTKIVPYVRFTSGFTMRVNNTKAKPFVSTVINKERILLKRAGLTKDEKYYQYKQVTTPKVEGIRGKIWGGKNGVTKITNTNISTPEVTTSKAEPTITTNTNTDKQFIESIVESYKKVNNNLKQNVNTRLGGLGYSVNNVSQLRFALTVMLNNNVSKQEITDLINKCYFSIK